MTKQRLDWLADVLRDAGCTVVEEPGWRGRGHDLNAVLGLVVHGTGSDGMSVRSTVNLLIEGRSPDNPKAPDHLPGPLAQGVDKDGVWHLIADGTCNHNGYGEWRNASVGVEMFGKTQFTPRQLAATQLGAAAILRHLDLPPSRCKGHKETDPGRKPDPIGVDMDAFRAAVGLDMDHLDRGTTPHQEDDDMPRYKDWPREDKMLLADDVAAAVIAKLEDDEHVTAANRLRKAAARADAAATLLERKA